MNFIRTSAVHLLTVFHRCTSVHVRRAALKTGTTRPEASTASSHHPHPRDLVRKQQPLDPAGQKNPVTGSPKCRVAASSLQVPSSEALAAAVSLRDAYADSHLRPIYLAPRHTLVLCHGLFGYDTLGPRSVPWLQRRYWSDIKSALENLGATVLTTSVPATGDVVQRASSLNKQLERLPPGTDVNLIGHSMGGLDCRFLTFSQSQRCPHEEAPYRIRSVTTLCTPHRGSPFMDWCKDTLGVGWAAVLENFPGVATPGSNGGNRTARSASASLTAERDDPNRARASMSGLGKTHPLVSRITSLVDFPAYACLTTDFCKNVFNSAVPDVPSVKYYSYGAAVEPPVYDRLRFPWEIINQREGPNDGIVSVESARWGKYWETLEADHFQLTRRCRGKVVRDSNGQIIIQDKSRMKETKPYDSTEFFFRVATRLRHEGF